MFYEVLVSLSLIVYFWGMLRPGNSLEGNYFLFRSSMICFLTVAVSRDWTSSRLTNPYVLRILGIYPPLSCLSHSDLPVSDYPSGVQSPGLYLHVEISVKKMHTKMLTYTYADTSLACPDSSEIIVLLVNDGFLLYCLWHPLYGMHPPLRLWFSGTSGLFCCTFENFCSLQSQHTLLNLWELPLLGMEYTPGWPDVWVQ